MGIPVGKLALYSACAGVHPSYCLPITLDVGTNNEWLLEDEMYIGLNQRRAAGEIYRDFIEEFVQAVRDTYPNCLLQFEDFGNHNAFDLLARYRNRTCCFNDDIQGTASVALAGLIAACRHTGSSLADQRLLFFGAGEAATGIGELFVSALVDEGMSEMDARSRCWFLDSQGLVVRSRRGLPAHKARFARDEDPISDLLTAVETIRPTALIGAAGVGGVFTQPVIEAMAQINPEPVIFALSNPTSKAECTAAQAYEWSGGKAIFASGSPFDPVEVAGKLHIPGQGNNVYIFPGVGLGVLGCRCKSVTDEMFLAAARALASMVTDEELACGRVFPALTHIREVSLKIALAVAKIAYREHLAQDPEPDDLESHLRACMFRPDY
jgi:malate dehydrogenase (oxaloacetate-decarboxylating)(NADP+)